MSVSFCNENPNKLTQKWLVSNKFYAGYYVATGMNSFLYKTRSDIMQKPLKVFIPRAPRFARLSEY